MEPRALNYTELFSSQGRILSAAEAIYILNWEAESIASTAALDLRSIQDPIISAECSPGSSSALIFHNL